ncbi:MAG: hypothetical protein JW870_11260 [Candidatus Delongbacteria bacterium]|nr:hypothetical protein [Candidatus Delongbacteria bacterium]
MLIYKIRYLDNSFILSKDNVDIKTELDLNILKEYCEKEGIIESNYRDYFKNELFKDWNFQIINKKLFFDFIDTEKPLTLSWDKDRCIIEFKNIFSSDNEYPPDFLNLLHYGISKEDIDRHIKKCLPKAEKICINTDKKEFIISSSTNKESKKTIKLADFPSLKMPIIKGESLNHHDQNLFLKREHGEKLNFKLKRIDDYFDLKLIKHSIIFNGKEKIIPNECEFQRKYKSLINVICFFQRTFSTTKQILTDLKIDDTAKENIENEITNLNIDFNIFIKYLTGYYRITSITFRKLDFQNHITRELQQENQEFRKKNHDLESEIVRLQKINQEQKEELTILSEKIRLICDSLSIKVNETNHNIKKTIKNIQKQIEKVKEREDLKNEYIERIAEIRINNFKKLFGDFNLRSVNEIIENKINTLPNVDIQIIVKNKIIEFLSATSKRDPAFFKGEIVKELTNLDLIPIIYEKNSEPEISECKFIGSEKSNLSRGKIYKTITAGLKHLKSDDTIYKAEVIISE